jgi:hypothetical protein
LEYANNQRDKGKKYVSHQKEGENPDIAPLTPEFIRMTQLK